MAKLVIKSRPSAKQKALAKKVTVEETADGTKITGTKEQRRAWLVETARKALKPK